MERREPFDLLPATDRGPRPEKIASSRIARSVHRQTGASECSGANLPSTSWIGPSVKLFAVSMLAAAQTTGLMSHVSSSLNDYNLSLDRSEQRLVLGRSEAEFRNAKIYIAERRAGRWSTPFPISFSDNRYSDSDPWLTPDGRTLFFISDRPSPDRAEGRKDYDIWQSTLVKDRWSEPVRLGSAVNSSSQELGPELHGGVLYFASARRSGAGGLDIYQARSRNGRFEQAELLPGPFNTEASESDFTLADGGRAAMFWRSVGERGMIHIAYREGGRWSEPTPLPPEINIGPFNFTPSFSPDGRKVRYSSTLERPGQDSGLADIYERAIPGR